MLGTNGSAAPDQIAPDVARTLLPQQRAFDTCDTLSRHATGIVQRSLPIQAAAREGPVWTSSARGRDAVHDRLPTYGGP